jgi:hypothetical protein
VLPRQVINHKKVDALLMQWEAAIAERERALLKLKRTGREPMRFSGKLGSLLNACTACGCAGCPDATDLCGSCCQQHVVEVIPEIEVGDSSCLDASMVLSHVLLLPLLQAVTPAVWPAAVCASLRIFHTSPLPVL